MGNVFHVMPVFPNARKKLCLYDRQQESRLTGLNQPAQLTNGVLCNGDNKRENV